MKRALIFLHGNLSDVSHVKEYLSDSVIICADGGTEHALSLGIIPDIVVGDLDSLSSEHRDILTENSVQMQTYPREKDMTDGEIAIQYAIDKGCNEIIVTGLLGDRIDHVSANLMRVAVLSNEHSIRIIEHDQEIWFVSHQIVVAGKRGDEISLIPFQGDSQGVTTEGLMYTLKDATLSFGSTRGISNVMEIDKATVSVKSGLLMVVHRRVVNR